MGGAVVMPGEPEPPAREDEFSLWLAAYDERLAAGASVASLDEVGAPLALRSRLEREAAWCQLVRRIWPQVAEPEPDASGPLPPDQAKPTDSLLSELGRFVIRRELGRGSFGIVYLAFDARLRRELALKVPRAEVFLTPELRARFRHEAMAAAGLDHPNIVPVYEAGEEGPVCFIASAYCPGITLAAWLRQRQRPVPYHKAASLVATLAEAVEHAHRRGVLHRDLKPSNVLLELSGGATEEGEGDCEDLVPRITDFGLAKLMDDGSGANASVNPTQMGVLLGTPSYMAPEQADGKPGAVGPAADIYSLGVILYEVLTGRPPFQEDSVLQTLVLVRTQDPLPPSRLRGRLPRDLETICLKCLHKQPQSRYATAEALAEDLRRFLAVEPIRARPTPPWERALKWARRRPALAALGGTTALAVITLAIVIGLANVRLKRERDRAEIRRLEAVANLRKARDAVDRMLTRVSEQRLKDIPQVEPIQRALLEDALEFYRDFARQAHDDPEVLLETSRAYRRLGQTYQFFGRIDEAERCFREAIALQDNLAAALPAIASHRAELITTRVEVAKLCRNLDRTKEALEAVQQALALADGLTGGDPENFDYTVQQATALHVRAMIFQDLHQDEGAKADYHKAIELFDDLARRFPDAIAHQTKATLSRHNLAILVEDHGQLDESEKIHRLNLKFWERLAASEPSHLDYRSKVAMTLESLAALLEKTSRDAEALATLRRAAIERSSITRDFPNTPYHFGRLADSLSKLAKLATARGDLAEARRLREESLAARRAALALAPLNAEYVKSVASVCAELIETLIRLKDHQAASKIAVQLVSLSSDSGEESLRVGSFLSRCVSLATSDSTLPDTRRAELAKAYADQAVAMVRLALKKGRGDLEALRQDASFDSVRARPDFGSLLADSVATSGKSKP
jgi:eukaryotic-like serine/threonine-protein kinase